MVCKDLLISGELSLRDEMHGSKEPVDGVSSNDENGGATTGVLEKSSSSSMRLMFPPSFIGVEVKGVLFEVDKLESNDRYELESKMIEAVFQIHRIIFVKGCRIHVSALQH